MTVTEAVAIVAGTGAAVFAGLWAIRGRVVKAERRRREAAEDRVNALKGSIAATAAAIESDEKIVAGEKKLDQAIKEAKNAEDVAAIRRSLARRLDGLL
jgi:hypothetical protein